MSETETIDVKLCARCGHEHTALEITEFTSPPPRYSHWTHCPDTQEPILIRFRDEPDKVYQKTKPEMLEQLKDWFAEFFKDNPFPKTVVEWDHYDKSTRILFVKVLGDWCEEDWDLLEEHMRMKFKDVLVGVKKV